MPDLQKFCDRMRFWCDQGNLGYDQSNRWDIRVGGECDCSSLVIFALQEAGFDTGSASYTGNMSSNLTARGWQRIPFTWSPKAGDILLNDANHVAVWLGDCLAQASIDENGRISGGASGDQTDRETYTRTLYNYPWDCILRYGGGSASSPETESSDIAAVQQWTNATYGYSQAVDGIDGPATKKGLIIGYQTELNRQFGKGLEVDGIAGPLTDAAAEIIEYGDLGNITQILQGRLICLGYDTGGFDGIFGSKTDSAVRAFQKANGLEVDGQAGIATWSALF